MSPEPPYYGAMAEFRSVADLLAAVRKLRTKGYRQIDALSPFPLHGLERAIGRRNQSSLLGWIALATGLAGAGGALWFQWWVGVVNYPLVIGGQPLFAWEFALPVTFEVAVLVTAFVVVGAMLVFNGLPRLSHPTFNYSRSSQATDASFVVIVEAEDECFDKESTPALLRSLGGAHVELVQE